MYESILVPTDGSAGVQRAIDHALDLANLSDASLHALYVVETPGAAAIPEAQVLTMEDALEEAGRDAVEQIDSRAGDRKVPAVTAIRHGVPHEEILEYADAEGIDLIVMGTHGRSGLDRMLLGSVTENVIRKSDVPVLVQRIDAKD